MPVALVLMPISFREDFYVAVLSVALHFYHLLFIVQVFLSKYSFVPPKTLLVASESGRSISSKLKTSTTGKLHELDIVLISFELESFMKLCSENGERKSYFKSECV